jgi:hypothetical protein
MIIRAESFRSDDAEWKVPAAPRSKETIGLRKQITALTHVRFRGECVAKLFAARRASNNRIEANKPLNQYCALAVDIESMLRGRALKIVLQHIRG